MNNQIIFTVVKKKFNLGIPRQIFQLFTVSNKLSCTFTDFHSLYTIIAEFNKDLEKDIIGDTSGHLKRLLVGLCQSNRGDGNEVDRNKAHQDAKAMYEAGEKKWGTDESRFNVILVSRSYPQLRATFEEYKKISKKDIEEALKSEMSGDLLRGFLTIGVYNFTTITVMWPDKQK